MKTCLHKIRRVFDVEGDVQAPARESGRAELRTLLWMLGASRRTGFLGHWRTLMPKVLSHGHQNSKASIKLDGASFAESLKRG